MTKRVAPKTATVPREPRTAEAATDSLAAHENDRAELAAPPLPTPAIHDATPPVIDPTAGGNVEAPHKGAVYEALPCMGGGPLDGRTATVRVGVRYYQAPSGDGRWKVALYERIAKGDGTSILIYRGMT